MFNWLNKKKIDVVSPVSGRQISLIEVPDAVFASKMMGEGVAFELSEDVVVSPIDGIVTLMPESKHAFGLVGSKGLEILVHIGLDTVNLQGEGFESYVRVGAKVKKGDPIIKVNREQLIAKQYNLLTPMVIINHSVFNLDFKEKQKVQAGKTTIIECDAK